MKLKHNVDKEVEKEGMKWRQTMKLSVRDGEMYLQNNLT